MLKKILVFLLFSALITLHTSLLLASEINLPRTGQTLCYDATGTAISCSGTGQDGEILAGQPWPAPRFTNNGNGTVTDNLTGLIWLQNANCSATLGGIFKTTTLSWGDALTWSNNLANGYCGLTDASTAGQWRLPTRLELASLLDTSKVGPSLPIDHIFTNVESNMYWSSSTVVYDTSTAWIVDFFDAYAYASTKAGIGYVLPVRGGQ